MLPLVQIGGPGCGGCVGLIELDVSDLKVWDVVVIGAGLAGWYWLDCVVLILGVPWMYIAFCAMIISQVSNLRSRMLCRKQFP